MIKKLLKYSVYILIVFFINITFIMASCTVGYVTCPSSNETDYIVQPRITKNGKTNQNAYDDATGITFQYWQRDKKPVFCIVKGRRGPMYAARYPESGWDKKITCQTNYNFSKNNGKLKAAIGYVIKNYASNTLPQQEGDSSYKAYVKVQSLVYKLLYDKNGGEAFSSYDADIYANMLDEYNSYGSESVSISDFTLNLIGDNWEATVPITKRNVDSVSVDSLKKGSTELKQYASISGNNVNISIPSSQLSNGDSIILEVKGTRTYYLADARTCDDNRQPIVTTTTTSESKPTSDSATGTVQKKHTLDINVVIDGELKYAFSSNVYATSNFSVGGKKIWEGFFEDHSGDYVEGSSYSITNISAKDGYEYKGYNVDDHGRGGIDSTDNTIKGQINEFTAINLTFVTTESYTIKKINSRNEKVMGEVIFNVYSDDSCTQNLNKQIKVSNGSGSTNLPLGTLYIQEQSAPQSYHVDTTCKPITVTKDGTNEITITNKTKCEYDFEQDNSIYNRLNLYKIHGYRNLLNFDIVDSWEACSPYEPNYDSQESCLYTDKVNIDTENKFTSSDLSDYNDNITSNGSISYCLTDFELESLIGINSPVKAGRLAYGFNDNNDAITGTITKTCYIHEDDISNYGIDSSSVLSNYVRVQNVDNNVYYYIDINDTIKIPLSMNVFNSMNENHNYFLTAPVNFIYSNYRKVLINSIPYYLYLYNTSKYIEFVNLNNNINYRIYGPHIGGKFRPYLKSNYSLFYNSSDRAYYFILNSTLNENYVLKKGYYFHKNYIDAQNPQNSNSILTELFSADNLYTKNIGNISLEGKVVSSSNEISDLTPTISSPVKKGEFYVVTGTLGVDYKLNPVSVYKLSGKECSGTDGGCTQIGYGILSKFKDAKNSTKGAFDFSISEGFDTVFKSEKDFRTDIKCEYDVDPEIIKYNNNDNGNLDLEFRTIDTKNPFNRTPKSNWNDGSNKNDSDNSIINNYILNATNSYGIKNGVGNQTPKYKIILTPDVVQEIREDNKIVKYDDYYELCEENNCKSKNNFLNDLYEKGVIE